MRARRTHVCGGGGAAPSPPRSLGPALDRRGRARNMATVMTPGGELETKVKTLFTKMDKDGDGTITKDEAAQWFKSFGKVSATAMFNEVDTDKSSGIKMDEWVGFWNNVISHGYSEPEALEELENLEKGEAWVDFDDERQT